MRLNEYGLPGPQTTQEVAGPPRLWCHACNCPAASCGGLEQAARMYGVTYTMVLLYPTGEMVPITLDATTLEPAPEGAQPQPIR